VLAGLYTWRVEPEWLEVVERRLPVARLPPDLAGRTLVQLSDLHVGSVDETYLVDTLQRTAALGPDFVVFTGDFVTAGVRDGAERLRGLLPHFPLGRLGTAASLGNHDYGFRWSREKDASRVIAAAGDFGIPVLRNAPLLSHGLQIVGLDDLWSGRFDPATAFAEADPEAATIVLSHNPDTADLPGLQEYSGWILAGHTHGGQCKPPFLPPPILPVENRRYTAGEFALSGGRRMYINRGVGYILRVRFNVRPEVTLFHLERA
jgi:predicted MPP superfamily phosphohydrolase